MEDTFHLGSEIVGRLDCSSKKAFTVSVDYEGCVRSEGAGLVFP